MVKSLSKVIYKPDTQSTDEYIVIVDSEEFTKWKSGDTSIALANVVDSFNVLHSGQGSQGILGKPSKQQLDTVFGSTKDVDVVAKILKEGRVQITDGVKNATFGTANVARGSIGVDNRAKGNTGV